MTQKLADCQAKCNHCFNACLNEPDVEMLKECIRLNKACAEICGITLSMAASSSFFSEDVLKVCAKACIKCAVECRKHDKAHCRECAQASEVCAEACIQFI